MRVAVADIGTNSTRLLLADVDERSRAVTEIERRTTVTRLGQGVDQSGALADEAMARVFAALDEYRAVIESHGGADRAVAVLTSAVRDATNGASFTARIREVYGLDARTIPGAEEARLTFLGATSERLDNYPIVVIDIGGGSTELVVGRDHAVEFFESTQAGVVRQTERHITTDPPDPDELAGLTEEVRGIFAEALPEEVRARVCAAVAVAGTATSMAAIDQDLEPYDPARVHGHVVSLGRLEELLARLAAMTEEQRRHVDGLHPDRAPTIVAGVVLLIEALRAFGLEEVEVSEHDILRGAALDAAASSGV